MTTYMSSCCLVLAAQFIVGVCAAAEPTQAPANRPALMDREKEIALALSACPANLQDKAGIYVLEEPGYVKVRDSQNGFTAIVQHTLPTSVEPECLDAEGTHSVLPRFLKVAELRAQGKAPDEIRRFMADGFAKGMFQPPARPGVIYMLSPGNVPVNFKGNGSAPYPPHVMIYAPYLTNADLGINVELDAQGNPTSPVFVAAEGTPNALIIVSTGAHDGHSHPAMP